MIHRAVSRWDAPLDSGLRDRCVLDPGNAFMSRLGIPINTLVLVRPDEHIAAIIPIENADPDALYMQITGRTPPT